MEEKELKTSVKQRIFIIIIAIIMVGSIIASYAAIVISGSKGASSSNQPQIDEAKVAEYTAAYDKKTAEFSEAAKSDYDKFIKYRSEIKAYNESSANENGVQTKDLRTGSGADVTDSNYLAYYVGWCADESVFDSTFDNKDNPTKFTKILSPAAGMIEGWKEGVKGMKLGGIREITIPANLAYADKMEICGGYNKPIKFIMMAVANEGKIKQLSDELQEASMRLQYAQYGMDYDQVKQTQE